MRGRLRKWGLGLVAGLLAGGAMLAQSLPVAAATFAKGDVLVGTTGGHIQHRSPTGALIATLDTTVGNAFDTGMCFDLAGNLYATDIYSQAITKFDNMGNLVAAKWVDTSADGNNPESCVWNGTNTKGFVGGPSVAQIRQYSLAGAELTRNTVASPDGTHGSDWVDLSSDQCTVLYTNESNTIRRFNGCTGMQLTDFATVATATKCFALRIRPLTMEVMVACDDGAHRLSSAGVNLKTYALGDVFALNLDRDGKSFWTANLNGSNVFKVDIGAGTVLQTIATGGTVWGLAVFGEVLAANPTITTSLSGGGQSGAMITVTAGTAVHDSATLSASTNDAGGTVTYTVFSDNACTVQVASGGTKTVTNAVVPNSDPVTLTTTGTYFWQASYSGDARNGTADSVCTDETETVVEGIITAQGTTFSATEGQSSTPTVATFTDPDISATAAEYSATIVWGDGGTSAGTISGGAGTFAVSGTHTYAEEGVDHLTVTITDTDNAANNSANVTSTANVADAALTASPACSATTTLLYNAPTATFTDAASPSGNLSDFTATIDWGDGTVTAGTVTGPNGGPYTVTGSHTYAATGIFTITTTIHDVGGSMATTSCNTLGFAFAPGGGSFVIGDQNAATGASVTFWGSQWAKKNPTSGGSAPRSFKGFAEDPTTPSCGVAWTTDPGNSTPPPDGPLPTFMAVIVTSSVDKDGSQISGTTVHIVIVKTDPGYAANPGHAGTGTVVAVVC
jgi:hypothetical protein